MAELTAISVLANELRPVPPGTQTLVRDVTLQWPRGGPVRMVVNVD